jgi:VWFA-related protein
MPPEQSDFTISTDVHEVNLVFSVTNSRGRVVGNLTANDLRLLDNHQTPEKWDYFQARTNLPLRVILAIDDSSSIRSRLEFEQKAASTFLQRIVRKETDKAAIIAFGSAVQEKTIGLTSDQEALAAAIHTLRADGDTAMYDAIVLACRRLQENHNSSAVRPVIILVSDGDDNASKATLNAAEEAAFRAEATIFALDSNSIYETHPKGREILERLTRETGGFILSAREDSDLKSSFATIEHILRSQYAIGYRPPGLEANGHFRSVEVSALRRNLRIHVRKGYFAPRK